MDILFYINSECPAGGFPLFFFITLFKQKKNPSPKKHNMTDTTRILNNESGYATNVFAEKNEQMVQVCENLENLGFLPKELVKNEVTWFYK